MTTSDVKTLIAELTIILDLFKEKDPKAIEKFEKFIQLLKG